jgi:ribonuclease J
MSEIVFYEGLNGSGVVASITYGKSRVIFDFGAPFNPMTQPYDGQVERRPKAWVEDAIRLNQIPRIDGVFRADDLSPSSGIIPYEDTDLTSGVIISHLHLDHMSGIGMVHPDIPVYIHREGYNLQLVLNEIGESVGKRKFSPVDLYVPFQIGEIRITPYFSDHPCAGSVGYLIEPPDGKYYYSGDVRFHGNNMQQAIKDVEQIAMKDVDVLILEMTTISSTESDREADEPLLPSMEIPHGMVTENQLLNQVLEDLKLSEGVGIFNIYHRDIGLIKGLFEIARDSNREIIFEPKTAFLVMELLGIFPAVFVPDNRDYVGVRPVYLEEVLQKASRVVDTHEMQISPGKFFLQNSYENILELFDIPSRGARYYHLYGTPMVAGARDYVNMMGILNLCRISYATFADLYCYNHAYPNNLLYLANRIKAKNIIGVHSPCPERFNCEFSRQVLPKKNEVYKLENGNLNFQRNIH